MPLFNVDHLLFAVAKEMLYMHLQVICYVVLYVLERERNGLLAICNAENQRLAWSLPPPMPTLRYDLPERLFLWQTSTALVGMYRENRIVQGGLEMVRIIWSSNGDSFVAEVLVKKEGDTFRVKDVVDFSRYNNKDCCDPHAPTTRVTFTYNNLIVDLPVMVVMDDNGVLTMVVMSTPGHTELSNGSELENEVCTLASIPIAL